MTGRWKINNTDIYAECGVYIFKSNYNELLAPPMPRRRLEHEYIDLDGTSVDTLTPLTYEARRFTIKVGLIADSAAEFWYKYNLFFGLISQAGSFALYIADLEQTYTLLYEGVAKAEKLTPIHSAAGKVVATFDIKLFEPVQTTLPGTGTGSGADLLIINNGVITVVNNVSDAFIISDNKLYLNID